MLSSSHLEKVMQRAGVCRRGFDVRRSFRVGFRRSWTPPPLPELSSRAGLPRASLIFDADVQAPTAWPVALSHFGAGAGRSGTPAIVPRGGGKVSGEPSWERSHCHLASVVDRLGSCPSFQVGVEASTSSSTFALGLGARGSREGGSKVWTAHVRLCP